MHHIIGLGSYTILVGNVDFGLELQTETNLYHQQVNSTDRIKTMQSDAKT